MTNSAKVTGDSSRVVGYGSWFLYEGNKNEYIKKYYSDTVLKICKDSILSGFQLGEITPKDYPCVLEETGASFVTLELAGILRGCIGSVIAHKPLVKDLIKNAHAAAFSDPRFNPLTIDEYNKISISVSLLSKPKRIEFRDEEDLLNKLVPYEDGLIIRDGNYQAVFLPIVWEQLRQTRIFKRT
ncbi:MAG: AmmeMemoRadiSam system protein A [Candidatus Gastranaerophilaceae bacterium]